MAGYFSSDPQAPSNFIPGAMILLVSQGVRYMGFGVTAVPTENGSVVGSPHIGPLRSFRGGPSAYRLP